MNDPISMYINLPVGGSMQSAYASADLTEINLNTINGALTLKTPGNIPTMLEVLGTNDAQLFAVKHSGIVESRMLRLGPLDEYTQAGIVLNGNSGQNVNQTFEVNAQGRVAATSIWLYPVETLQPLFRILDATNTIVTNIDNTGHITTRVLEVAVNPLDAYETECVLIKNRDGNITLSISSDGTIYGTRILATSRGNAYSPGIAFYDEGGTGLYVTNSYDICMTNKNNTVLTTNTAHVGVPGKLFVGSEIYPEHNAAATITTNNGLSLRCTGTSGIHNKIVCDTTQASTGIELGVSGSVFSHIMLDYDTESMLLGANQMFTPGNFVTSAIAIRQDNTVFMKGVPYNIRASHTTTDTNILNVVNATMADVACTVDFTRNGNVHHISVTAGWEVTSSGANSKLTCNLQNVMLQITPAPFEFLLPPATVTGVCYMTSLQNSDRYLCGWELTTSGMLSFFLLPYNGTLGFAASLTWHAARVIIEYLAW